jgi:hypothetical protein
MLSFSKAQELAEQANCLEALRPYAEQCVAANATECSALEALGEADRRYELLKSEGEELQRTLMCFSYDTPEYRAYCRSIQQLEEYEDAAWRVLKAQKKHYRAAQSATRQANNRLNEVLRTALQEKG